MSTIENIKKSLLSKRSSIIAIDGPLASGKSTLANQIFVDHGYDCIHVDDFLEIGTGEFYTALKLDKFKEKILSLSKPFVIEGVCMINIMESLNIYPYVLIYLQESLSGYKKWNDKLEIEVSQYIEKYLPNKKAD